ncbi:hypothetical protein KCP69_06415 [Salmonella enterica subsp. enterica]|nr:hypothetical protein KCP69_06415 [Salmonella enterica subsp. enterica]
MTRSTTRPKRKRLSVVSLFINPLRRFCFSIKIGEVLSRGCRRRQRHHPQVPSIIVVVT